MAIGLDELPLVRSFGRYPPMIPDGHLAILARNSELATVVRPACRESRIGGTCHQRFRKRASPL